MKSHISSFLSQFPDLPLSTDSWLEAFNSQVSCVSGFPHKYKKKTKQQTSAASLFWYWDGESSDV